MPTVSIGLPVYNGEVTLVRAIDSLLNQSYTDFELIISDNASSDSTEEICQRYKQEDQRVRYVRQSGNLGANWNFRFVVTAARGEYFAWHADDDFRSPGNIEKNLRFLKNNPNFSGSASPNCFEHDELRREQWSTFTLEQPTYIRLQRFLDHRWLSHGIVYSLFRKDILLRVMEQQPNKSILAEDWFYIILTLLEGPIKRIEDELVVIGTGGISQSPNNISRFQYNLADYIFPLNKFALLSGRAVTKSQRLTWSQKARLNYRLLAVNWGFKFKTG